MFIGHFMLVCLSSKNGMHMLKLMKKLQPLFVQATNQIYQVFYDFILEKTSYIY